MSNERVNKSYYKGQNSEKGSALDDYQHIYICTDKIFL